MKLHTPTLPPFLLCPVLSFLLSLLCPFNLLALTPPPDSLKISYSFFSADSLSAADVLPLDTLPDNIHFYDPATQDSRVFATQGNIGRPSQDVLPDFNLIHGFNAGIHAFDIYKFNPDLIKFYHHYYPFTDVHYVMGAKKEQLLDLVHSQNLGKYFVVSANLRIINSPGSYQRLKSDVSNLTASAQYHSNNEKYKANLSFCQNILKIQESGGIINDSIFEKNEEPDRRVIPVNLSSSENRIRETSVIFAHQYQFIADSLLNKQPWLHFLPLILRHSAKYSESSFVFEDPGNTSNFYPFSPLDSSITQDELIHRQLTNKILFVNPGFQFLTYAAGLSHENIFIRDERNKAEYNQLSGSFDMLMKLPGDMNLRTTLQKFFGGYNDGDNFLLAKISKQLYKNNLPLAGFSLLARSSSSHPSWIQMHYHSNLMNWERKFNSIETQHLSAEIFLKTLVAGYRWHSLKNFIINERTTSLPTQLSEKLNVTQLYFQLKFKLWKVVFDNRFDYQKVDKIQFLHLPQYITRHSVYLDFNLFRGAMILQPGFSVYWQSAYYADSYMPVTRTYYLQNKTRIGDQLFADVFVNMKVGRARLFLKYQHFNALFGPYDYFLVPHYPVQDAAFKFGVYWLLRDLPDRDKKFEILQK